MDGLNPTQRTHTAERCSEWETVFPREDTHQLVLQHQTVSPLKHTYKTTLTLMFRNTDVDTHTCMQKLMKNFKNFKKSKEGLEGLEQRKGRRK